MSDSAIQKFAPISTRQLILAVQSRTILVRTKKVKTSGTAKNIAMMSELREMRYVLDQRLKLMNRNSPDFFPVNARVEYSSFDPRIMKTYTIQGTVIGHTSDYVLATFDNEPQTTIQIFPQKLKLLYIREYEN